MSSEKFYELIETIPGRSVDKISKFAKEYRVHVVYPTYEKGPEGIIYNSSVLIDDEGEIVGIYRKTHLFPTERKASGGWSTPGQIAPVFNTKLGKVGMIICYDGDFPELSRVLALQGAEIITRPSALLRGYDIWELTNKARAYDNHVYFIGTNAIGMDAAENFYFGQSMIVSPTATVLAHARGTEEIVAARLNPDPLKYVSLGSKSPMIFDHIEDRNIRVYEKILLKQGKSVFEPAQRIPYLD